MLVKRLLHGRSLFVLNILNLKTLILVETFLLVQRLSNVTQIRCLY
ncbi:hypothetical protein FIU87_14300 [Bacillus sp. THAF10]|nr:hypothetical protein FIU87_14300 [Bacillus sp. THAF10]